MINNNTLKLDFTEAKKLMISAIDEGNTVSEIFEKFVQNVYQSGYSSGVANTMTIEEV